MKKMRSRESLKKKGGNLENRKKIAVFLKRKGYSPR